MDALLLDLDGVLIDSVPAIAHAFSAALVTFDRPPLTLAAARRFVGPPLEVSVAEALGTEDRGEIETFVTRFREVYAATYLERTLPADGLATVIPALAQDRRLVVATSKPEAFAVPLLERFGVTPHLHATCGRTLALDGETKADVVARALTHLAGIPRDRIRMVGDRRHDVEGARVHGILTIGVLHGAGSREELVEAGADCVVQDLHAVQRLVIGQA